VWRLNLDGNKICAKTVKMHTTGIANIRRFVHDAKRFILDYAEDIEHSPLNIYPNALRCIQSGSMEKINIPRFPSWGNLHFGEVCGTLPTAEINDIAFSPDGKLLATASIDGTVNLWDPATRETLRVLRHNDTVGAIAFSLDGNLLACAVTNMRDWTIKLWDPATGKEMEVRNPMEAVGMAHSIAFSPDGKLLALAVDIDRDNGIVCLLDPLTGHSLQTFHHCSESQSIAFSPDGKLLASSWGDGVVKIWDPHTGYEIRTFEGHINYDDCSSDIAFSPDGQLLASSSDNEVKIWDPVTGIKQQTLVHTGSIFSIAFSPDGKLLAAALMDKTVELWEPTTGRGQGTLVGHSGSLAPITFSPDGNMLAWATYTSVLRARNSPCIAEGEVELWELYINE
jgi:WD40 repeat protein